MNYKLSTLLIQKITPPTDGVINLSHVVDEKGLHRFMLFAVPITSDYTP